MKNINKLYGGFVKKTQIIDINLKLMEKLNMKSAH